MKILVATGSFKDVFSPIEAAEIISKALDHKLNTVDIIPFCDGGEYTFELLKKYLPFQTVIVERVLSPYGTLRDIPYFVNGEEAHLVSSCVLRLYPDEDKFKNPLTLTDYGYGQLVADAINKGCKKLVLYIGGTSTACCGMGMIQALGIKLFTAEGEEIQLPCRGEDLQNIARIDNSGVCLPNVDVLVVADGNSKTDALPGITGLKVGKFFSAEKARIVSESMHGIENVIHLTGISVKKDFTGAAGGLLFGLEQVFPEAQYVLGGLYFSRFLNVEKKIEEADLVITGEGRYDNTADGKAPSVITRLAKKHGKPAILVCGQHDKRAIPYYKGGIVDCRNDKKFQQEGITAIITGQEYYDQLILPQSYQESIDLFREKTPALLQDLFQQAGL